MSDPVSLPNGVTVGQDSYKDVDYITVQAPGVLKSLGAYVDRVWVPVAGQLAFAKAVAPEGYQVVPLRLPRADCPVCGFEYATTAAGVMRRHMDSRSVTYRVCAGAGAAPKAAS